MPATQLSWFDSHCHFDFEVFDSDRGQHWQQATREGLCGLIIPGISRQQGQKLASLCAQKPWFYAQGLHPYFLDQHQTADIDWLEKQLTTDNNVIAVGEIGLDKQLAKTEFQLAQQQQYFYSQVELAQQYSKKLILHVRGMHDEACSYLRQKRFTYGGIVHAFSGSEQQAKAWLDLGFKLGIGGAMTHPRAQKLRRTVRAIPLEAWLLETDSPDMKPAFWAAKYNSPRATPLLAACLAAIKDKTLADIALAQQLELIELWPSMRGVFE